jgi:hypothetical protein
MKRRVGALLVRSNRIVSTGYNGTPRGMRNCNEGGCARCNSGTAGGGGRASFDDPACPPPSPALTNPNATFPTSQHVPLPARRGECAARGRPRADRDRLDLVLQHVRPSSALNVTPRSPTADSERPSNLDETDALASTAPSRSFVVHRLRRLDLQLMLPRPLLPGPERRQGGRLQSRIRHGRGECAHPQGGRRPPAPAAPRRARRGGAMIKRCSIILVLSLARLSAPALLSLLGLARSPAAAEGRPRNGLARPLWVKFGRPTIQQEECL